jgi:hypothetical protein
MESVRLRALTTHGRPMSDRDTGTTPFRPILVTLRAACRCYEGKRVPAAVPDVG